jgi:hypothetical protein
MRLLERIRCVAVFGICGACAAGGAPSAGDDAEAAGRGCAFEIDAGVSEVVPTVGIVEWSTTLETPTAAEIHFGLDEEYGAIAPVDLERPGRRTLLLGMKPERTYHFRVQVTNATGTCHSGDHTLSTGSLSNELPELERATFDAHEPTAGFLMSGFLLDGPAFILDADGDYVFAYGAGEMGRVRLNHAMTHLYYASVNVAGEGPSMKRVSLDGLVEEDLTAEFGALHHDFTVLPDETVAFIRHGELSDSVAEYRADGSVVEILNLGHVFQDGEKTHANSLQYAAFDDTYTLSDLAHDAFVKFDRNGSVIWILGGEFSDFTGDGASWDGQHGHQLLGPERIVFFNNGPFQADAATALEVALDLDSLTATRVWQYSPGETSRIYGDVQRLAMGNTLVTFSAAGLIQEVSSEGELVEELSFELGSAIGYASKLPSLYVAR